MTTTCKTPIYTPEDLNTIDQFCIPHHIAIIPDGNRRWAKQQLTSQAMGHSTGADTIIEIVKAAKELGIKVITFYLFSTENWKRPQEEVAFLMVLYRTFLDDHKDEMVEGNIRLHTIGDLSAFPIETLRSVEKTRQMTADCTGIDLVVGLNYGSRDEIRRAMQKIIEACYNKKISKEDVTESLISEYLDTAPWGDPDLFIRTGGEKRLSNFLLWQLSYSEVYISDVLWPDFNAQELLKAIADFQKRERRLGGA